METENPLEKQIIRLIQGISAGNVEAVKNGNGCCGKYCYLCLRMIGREGVTLRERGEIAGGIDVLSYYLHQKCFEQEIEAEKDDK